MKKTVAGLLIVLSAFILIARAQDEDIEKLANFLKTMEQINALPVNFEPRTAKLTPIGEINAQKHAALIKKLPAGVILEIGVHVPRSGAEAANLKLTALRAEALRKFLLAYKIAPTSLVSKGYGSSKPSLSFLDDTRNDRVEYIVLKSGLTVKETAAPAKPSENAIVAGNGWGKVRLGATKVEIESVLGKPEISSKDTFNPVESYATFYSKGLVVIYTTADMRAIRLRFIGNAALYGAKPSEFRSFSGIPDKGLSWGSTSAQVLAAYGTPQKREAYQDFLTKLEIANLYYQDIHFIFKGDKLFQINLNK